MALSTQHFSAWLDALAVGATNGGGDPLVRTFNGHRLEGYFHKMKQGEHAAFLSAIQGQVEWAQRCVVQQVSAGTLVSIEPDRRGSTKMLHIKGPFI